MPRCSVCNNRFGASQLNGNLVCRSCVDNQKKKDEAKLKENVDILAAGRGKPQYQRIYDAFVRTYPDAVITGLSCFANPFRILVYLDDDPMYYATFDPLRSSVQLQAYVDDNASTSNSVPTTTSVEPNRCQVLAVTASSVSLALFLYSFLSGTHLLASMFFGMSAIVALICSSFGKGGAAVVAGVLMVLTGMCSDITLIIPSILVIYGSTKY